MAEKHLGERGVARDAWPGLRFRWAENLSDGMWAAVVLEIERRGEQWVVTRLDRKKVPVRVEETGFRELASEG